MAQNILKITWILNEAEFTICLLNETEFYVQEIGNMHWSKICKIFFFFFPNPKAKYVYLVLASVRALLDCGADYNDGSGDLDESIFWPK